jgi:FecR protein
MLSGSISAVGSAGAQSSTQISTIQSRLRTWRAEACILIVGMACQCPEAPLHNFCLKVPYKLGGHHMYRPHLSVPLAVIVAGIAGASSAHATVRVGYAMMVERNVSGTLSGQQRKVLKGDDVFENDFIRTETESSARLLFVDKTQLMLGPTAIAKLDRLVFNPDQSVSALTVSARQGAVRWISGESASNAYQVETSTVTIRPHGTIFDVLAEPQRTTIVLQEGIIEVCLISAPQRCRVLFRRGELITATLDAIEAPQLGGPGSSDFEDRCLSAAGNGCVIGISVNPPTGPSQKPGVGEKRAEPRAPSNTPYKVTSVPAVDPPPVPSNTPYKVTTVPAVDPTPVVNSVGPDMIAPPVIVPPRIIWTRHNPPGGGDYNHKPPGGGDYNHKPPGDGNYNHKPPGGGNYPTPSSGAGSKPWPGKPGKGSPTPPTSIGHPTPTTGSGKDSAGVYKNNPQMRGSIGDNPRLRMNRNVAMAHASVESVKPSTPTMASGMRANSMVPRQSFSLMGLRRMGAMGAPRLPFGGMRMRPFGGMGLFRLH